MLKIIYLFITLLKVSFKLIAKFLCFKIIIRNIKLYKCCLYVRALSSVYLRFLKINKLGAYICCNFLKIFFTFITMTKIMLIIMRAMRIWKL